MNNEVTTYQIGDGLELMLEGAPKAALMPEHVASSAMALVKHAIPMAATISPGVIGSVQTAIFKIASHSYEVKYALRATRVIKAAEIYSQCVGYLEYLRATNRMDYGIASDAIAHLRADFQEELAYRRSLR